MRRRAAGRVHPHLREPDAAEHSLTLGVDPASFANNFATARALLGNPETPVLTVKPRVVGRKVASDRAG
jgi:hypothetical protein